MNSKILSQARDLAAKKHGYADWFQIDMTEETQDFKLSVKANLVDDVAIEYEKLLRIGKTEKQRRDFFAGTALQALISKMPFLDEKGELGQKISGDELQEIKKAIVESAWHYADWMLHVDNEKNNDN